MTISKDTKPSVLARKGLAMRDKVLGPEYVAKAMAGPNDFMTMFQDMTNEFCWGKIWSRPALSIKKRTMLSLAITAALCQTPAVKIHTHSALRAGWTRKEIGEILLHVYVYAGVYASLSSFAAANEVFDELDHEAKKKPKAAGGRRRRASVSGVRKAKSK
jgi:4-carboxymuconolactone decarboxylase